MINHYKIISMMIIIFLLKKTKDLAEQVQMKTLPQFAIIDKSES